MALGIAAQYPSKSEAPNADYPFGSARNITVPSDGTGTPLEKAWFNDYVGFFSTLLNEVGEIPSGNPDTVLVPQYLNALRKGRPLVDVRAFGAKGDGATDDTVALQAAIDYVNGLTGGGIVAIPSGVYVTQKLTLKSNVHLLGAGGALELKDNSDSALLEIPVGSERIAIEYLTLDGNSANNAGTPVDTALLLVLSTNVAPTTNVLVNECQILDAQEESVRILDGTKQFSFTNNVIDGTINGDALHLGDRVPLDTIVNAIISGNLITNVTKYQIFTDGKMINFVVTRNVFGGAGGDGTSAVVRIRNFESEVVCFSNNVVKNGTSNGLILGARDFVCSHNIFDNNDGISISINGGGVGDMKCGVVDGNVIIGGAGTTKGINIIDIESVAIGGNNVLDCPNGIVVAANQYSITGNSVKGHTATGIATTFTDAPGGTSLGGAITGNTVVGISPGSTTSGINCGTDENAVSGNRVTDCATGLSESGGRDFNAFVGNVARGNTTPFSVSGASTIEVNNVV